MIAIKKLINDKKLRINASAYGATIQLIRLADIYWIAIYFWP